jgi:DNA processing protein
MKPVLARLKSLAVDAPSVSEAIGWLKPRAFSQAQIRTAMAQTDRILEQCHTLDIAVHAYGSLSYPAQLERLAQPPAVLFSRGRFDPELKPRVAVIGTRKPTSWGMKTAKACARQVAASQGVVVSGLAPGIDSAAHRAAIDCTGLTWAVLPHGLAAPAATAAQRRLAEEMLDAGGALLSEYPPDARSERHYFVERDRIQAGLSDAVLLIESEPDGGAMHTVRFARQAKVPVWVTLPAAARHSDRGRLPPVQRGPWQLLSQGNAIRVPSARALDGMIRALV